MKPVLAQGEDNIESTDDEEEASHMIVITLQVTGPQPSVDNHQESCVCILRCTAAYNTDSH